MNAFLEAKIFSECSRQLNCTWTGLFFEYEAFVYSDNLFSVCLNFIDLVTSSLLFRKQTERWCLSLDYGWQDTDLGHCSCHCEVFPWEFLGYIMPTYHVFAWILAGMEDTFLYDDRIVVNGHPNEDYLIKENNYSSSLIWSPNFEYSFFFS